MAKAGRRYLVQALCYHYKQDKSVSNSKPQRRLPCNVNLLFLCSFEFYSTLTPSPPCMSPSLVCEELPRRRMSSDDRPRTGASERDRIQVKAWPLLPVDHPLKASEVSQVAVKITSLMLGSFGKHILGDHSVARLYIVAVDSTESRYSVSLDLTAGSPCRACAPGELDLPNVAKSGCEPATWLCRSRGEILRGW